MGEGWLWVVGCGECLCWEHGLCDSLEPWHSSCLRKGQEASVGQRWGAGGLPWETIGSSSVARDCWGSELGSVGVVGLS